MSRRIDIELTSALSDGTWTWRAAGARHPKGVVNASVLPADAKVGDEFKVEIEQEIDGITVLGVVQTRQKAGRTNVIELLPAEREFQPIVETRAPGGRGRRDGDRRPRRDRDGDGERRPRRERGDDRGGGSESGERRPRRDGNRGRRGPSFTPPPEVPQRPRPQRLKAGKSHRTAVLAELPEEQRPIAELALQGIPAVRSRIREENQKAAAEGRAQMPEQTVIKMAEELLPKLRVAEWKDRAEAAQRQLANLDLRDLRSVVASANDPIVARDESTRALAQELAEALATKQEEELQLWYGDVDAALAVGRVIRALRLSSQPPKAGVPFPADIAQRLIDSTNASLAPMDAPDRWEAMLEAAAFSPVRTHIKPVRKPDVVTDELLATVRRLAPALPHVAALFEIEVDPNAPMPKPLRPGPRGKDARGKGKEAGKSDAKSKDERRSSGRGRDQASAGAEAAADTNAAPAGDEATAESPAPAATAEAPDAATTPEPAAGDAVTDDTPAEQTDADASTDDTPAEQTDADAPTEDTPAEQTDADAPTEDTPAEQTDADAPTEDTPAEQADADAPTEDTPAEQADAGAPADDTPADEQAAEA